MKFILPVFLGVIAVTLRVIAQYADEVDELFDPWTDNCESMNPGNFTNSTITPQAPPMPYEVTFSKTKINFQQGVYLRLSAKDLSHTFQGFMIHATDIRSGEATGQFDEDEDIEVFNCFGHFHSTAMHKNNTRKHSIRLRWVPDEDEVSVVTFYVTVAETVDPLENYWMRQKAGSLDITKALKSF